MNLRQVMQDIFGNQSGEGTDSENEPYCKASFSSDGRLDPEIQETDESKGEAEDDQTSDHLGVSRSTVIEKCTDQDPHRAIFRNLFGDSDVDEHWENDFDDKLGLENEGRVESKVDEKLDKTGASGRAYHDHLESSRSFEHSKGDLPRKKVGRSLKYEGNHAKEPLVGNVVLPDEVASPAVFEIPLCRHSVHPDQMETMKLSNIIRIASKPLDFNTYVEDEFYATDASGSKKRVPHTNIIRWRKARRTDGTTLVESNARFVIWSDGSTQLLIGNQAFNICEHDAQDIQSHLFLQHAEGIYESQGRISKTMKIVPSSSSLNSHRSLNALADSRHKKVNKVRQFIADADPERPMEQMDTEGETMKATKHGNKEKRATEKYRNMGRKEHERMPRFLSKGLRPKGEEVGSKQQVEVDEETLQRKTAIKHLMYYSDDE